jgi:hypothetical protein
VVWFRRLNQNGEVVRQWREHYKGLPTIDQLDDSVVWAVGDAALAEGDLSLAATVYESKPDRDRVAKLLVAALKKGDVSTATVGAVVAARLLVRTRAWSAAVRAAEDGSFSDLPGVRQSDLQSMLRKTEGLTRIFQAIVQELAGSDELASETAERKGVVTEFLHRHFIGKGTSRADWHGVTPEVAGAAIERAGKIVDALQFYENLERDASTTDELKNFAAERLVRNLDRHADYFQSRRDEAEVQQKRSRAQAIRERAGLGDRKISEYPVIRTATSSVGAAEWVRGPFKIVLSRAHARLRIEHMERFETVTVDGKDRCLLGDAAFSKLDAPGGRANWEVTGWGMTISLVDRGHVRTVVIEDTGEPFEIPLT